MTDGATRSAAWWPGRELTQEFVAPPFIVSGAGSSNMLPQVLRGLVPPGAVVAIAIDDVIASRGLAEPALESLQRAGFAPRLLVGFGSEPTAEVIDEVAEQARALMPAAIVGIGGGSVLDSAKLLAVLLRNGGAAREWIGAIDPPNGALPLALVPTTCGTGSEASSFAMVTIDGAKRIVSSTSFVPRAVVLDPVLLSTLPPQVIAATAMDALAHAVETLLSTNRSPMTMHHGLRAIELLVENVEAAASGDPDALNACLWAAHLGGQSLNASTLLGHSVAYALAHEAHISHGVSCAVALPYCIAYNRGVENGIARTLALELTRGRSESLRDAAGDIQELAIRLGLPTSLDDLGIAAGREGAMAERVVIHYPRPNNPVALDVERITGLLVAARTADLDAAFRT